MTTSNTGPFGAYRYTVDSGTWWWSEAVYQIHGFTPGEVVPTTELILSHKHPEDLETVQQILRTVLEDGSSFSLWHRIVDARQRVRTVLSVGGGVHDGSGMLTEIQGYLVDLTEPKRRALTDAVDEAVRASARSRSDIEQAKGVLMAAYRLDATAAFSLLRRYSQHANVKVRDVAVRLVEAVASSGDLPADVHGACADLLAHPEADGAAASQDGDVDGADVDGIAVQGVAVDGVAVDGVSPDGGAAEPDPA